MKKVAKFLKHLFIPHEHNDYKPHFFRETSVLAIFLLTVLLFSLSWGTNIYIKKNDMTAAVLPAVLVDLTNNSRTANNELALLRNPVLDKAAELKAKDMALNGYFAHTSPSGITPWHWFSEVGYSFVYAGENLAIDFTESVDVENAWMNSPTHRKNILNENFTEIGIATTDGFFEGKPTTFVVQMFGKPAFSSVSKIEEKRIDPQIALAPKNTVVSENKIPAVKGEAIEADNNLEIITDDKNFVSVKNIDIEDVGSQEQIKPTTKYSSWSQRFVFLMPGYTNKIYCVLIWLVALALLLMIVIEIRRQHPKNIFYGILLLAILLCFIFINKTVFLLDLFK